MLERMDTDRYGRTVGRLLTVAGDDANLAMVHSGNAVVYPKYCPRAEGSYYRAETDARSNNRVVWSMVGDQSAPWRWRNR
jgi:endonuclease YncB( thermonuclease family)